MGPLTEDGSRYRQGYADLLPDPGRVHPRRRALARLRFRPDECPQHVTTTAVTTSTREKALGEGMVFSRELCPNREAPWLSLGCSYRGHACERFVCWDLALEGGCEGFAERFYGVFVFCGGVCDAADDMGAAELRIVCPCYRHDSNS